MIQARRIAAELGLDMKIGDVEFQGDGTKAIFYYIADGRVDFRQLIKVYAEEFRIRIEMKQIGARQEAGLISGLGVCGRELCCANYITNFQSISTSAARVQDLSLNPQKLAGQCAKLKCCINFEVDTYMEAGREMPPRDVVLETKDRQYFQFKADVLKREVAYSTKKGVPENLVYVPLERVMEVMSLNENGVKPDKLELDDAEREFEKNAFGDILGQDAINRFDKKKRKKSKKQNARKGEKGDKAAGNEAPQNAAPEQPNQRENKDRGRNNHGGDNRPSRGEGKPRDPNRQQGKRHRDDKHVDEHKNKVEQKVFKPRTDNGSKPAGDKPQQADQ